MRENLDFETVTAEDCKGLNFSPGLVTTNAWPLVGGLELVSLRVAQGLRKKDCDARILCRFCDTRHGLREYFSARRQGRAYDNEGVPTDVLDFGSRELILTRPVFRLMWRKQAFPVASSLYFLAVGRQVHRWMTGSSLAHFLGSGPEMLGFAVGQAARKLGIPFLVEPAMHKGQWGDGWIDQRLYRMSDGVIAHSAYEAKCLADMGLDPQLVFLVKHGFDFREDGDEELFRNKHKLRGPLILFLGRRTKEKGYLLTLECFQRVRREFPESTLVLAGPGGQKGHFSRDSGVLDLGTPDEDEKQCALAACDVLCVPSEGESFGMVYYEAWAYNKPVIAIDLPTLRESIGTGEGGLLVDRVGQSLDVALRKLLSDRALRTRLGSNGRRLAEQHSWENATTSYLDIYHRVIERHALKGRKTE